MTPADRKGAHDRPGLVSPGPAGGLGTPLGGLAQGSTDWLHVTNLAKAELDAMAQPAGLVSALLRGRPVLLGSKAVCTTQRWCHLSTNTSLDEAR